MYLKRIVGLQNELGYRGDKRSADWAMFIGGSEHDCDIAKLSDYLKRLEGLVATQRQR